VLSAVLDMALVYTKIVVIEEFKKSSKGFTEERIYVIRNCFIAIVLFNQLSSLIDSHSELLTKRTQFKYRSGMLGIIYKKMFSTSLTSYKSYTPGKLSTMLQVDLNNIVMVFEFISKITYSVVTLTGVGFFMWQNIGIGTIVLVGCLLALIGFNSFLAYLRVRYNGSYLKMKDERVQLTKSIANNIRTIKMKALELFYCHKLKKSRLLELAELIRYLFTSFLITVVRQSGELFLRVCVLYYCTTFIEGITSKELNGFNLYVLPFNFSFSNITQVLISSSDIIASATRVKGFLQSENIKKSKDNIIITNSAVEIINGVYWWDGSDAQTSEVVSDNSDLLNKKLSSSNNIKNQKRFEITVETLSIKKGEMVVVVGDNGSGKSSLLYSIVGEMSCSTSTRRAINGEVSFISQSPWIIPGSIQENIVFGLEFDEITLLRSLKLSQFYQDVSEMENGVGTICEEFGANLSGGQRARLALARCFYQNSDVVIMDDPLKALDSKATKKIMEDGICKALRGKTRIITTNNHKHIRYADRVILVESGRIIYNGSFDEARKISFFKDVDFDVPKQETELQERAPEKDLNLELKECIEEEKMSFGRVSKKLLLRTIKSYGGMFGLPLVLLILCAGLYCTTALRRLLSEFVNEYTPGMSKNDLIYISMYTLGLSISVLAAGSLTIFLAFRFSKVLSFKMTFGFLHSRVSEYLDIVPSGVILNRFTNDLDIADRFLPQNIFNLMNPLLMIIFSLMMFYKVVGNVYLVMDTILFILLIIYLQNFYLKANNNLIRMELISRSPIVQACIGISSGITEIRTMNRLQYVERNCLVGINQNVKWFTLKQGVQNGFNFYVDMLNNYLLVLPSFFWLYLTISSDRPLNISIKDLTIFLNQVSNIGRLILEVVFLYNAIEMNCISLERCKEIEDLDHESGYCLINKDREAFLNSTDESVLKYYTRSNVKVVEQSSIKLKDLTARYPTRKKPVIRDINVEISAGQKVAIVGRSGAGKSSFAKLIWRALLPEEGTISFDNININLMNLKEMRAEISVVSQEIMVIDGTLRENIDPILQLKYELFGEEDRELEALTKERLIDLGFPKDRLDAEGFDLVVGTESVGLSPGHFQMICLVRETLSQKKIVVFDEVTSNLDEAAEKKFKEIFFKEFEHATIIIISHRLNTVLNCDMVMVMEKGELKEFGDPNNLLSNKDSEFYSLLQSSL